MLRRHPMAFAFAFTALAWAALALQARAEETTMSRSIEAASLHDGPLDMVAYYVPAPDGAVEVTATFAPRKMTAAAPMRLVMALGDGDHVAFSIPGYPQALYDFARRGADVTVSVGPVEAGAGKSAGL